MLNISPFLISEHKLAKFQVAQHDARLMTVCHGQSHLTEEPAGMLLVQPATALHQSVHVPKVFVQEHIGLAFTQNYVPETGHISVGRQDAVGSDLFLVGSHIKNLGERGGKGRGGTEMENGKGIQAEGGRE